MCGIAGIFAYGRGSERVDLQSLLAARDAMTPRGPDGEGLWISPDERVGLAHRRLAIIDLSPKGAQPMSLQKEGIHITFNGEIYNFRELRSNLESDGHVFQSHSDTEVLLHLYLKYGEGMCELLRGMFAFAIWDENKQGMLIARDHFGIKPLFIGRAPGTIVFSSQVKSILASGCIAKTPEPAGHVGFFIWGHIPQPYTLYKQIRELPAGHSIWVDQHGIREPRPYFDIANEIETLEESSKVSSHEEAQELLRFAVQDSVKHHFEADVPVGVFLSAGRDSTVLLAVSGEVTPQVPNSITLGFKEYEGTEDDEVPLASMVAKQYGSTHFCKHVLGSTFRDDMGKILHAMDQPSVDGLNTYYVSKVAHEFGMKVTLSGLGADELLGGYASFRQIPKLVSSLKGARNLPWLGRTFRVVTSSMMGRLTSPKYAGLLEYGSTYGGAYFLRRGLYMPWELPQFMDGEMVRDGWQQLQVVSRLNSKSSSIRSERGKVSSLELQAYMRNRLLRDSDWAGMAHSLEIRTPFVDIGFFRAVVPLFGTPYQLEKENLGLVPTQKLPPEILNRPKTGFNFPVREWILGEKPQGATERSLRGWAKMVYSELSDIKQ